MKNNNAYKLKENGFVMNKIFLVFVIALLLVSSASAVRFWKYDGLKSDNNASTCKWGVVTYDTFELTTENLQTYPSWWNPINIPIVQLPFILGHWILGDGISPDYAIDTIESGKPLEVKVAYNIYPATWNSYNLNNTVNYCRLQIRYSSNRQNGSTIIYENNLTTDLNDGSYFVKLQKGDTFYVDEQCFFNNVSERVLQIPADFTIVAPTWNCLACQYHEWQANEIRVEKATVLSGYSNNILGYMAGIMQIFYEFFVYAWWFLMIIMLLFVISLIFIGIYWMYNFLMRITK